jgi:hypothetical protein
MLESNAVLAQGKQRGLVADRPIGKVEFCLEPLDTPRPTVPAPEPAPRAPESDTEDQFAF